MAKLRSIFKKHLIPNLESKCRLCLSDKAIVHSIFQSDSSKEATDTLVEKIFECTAIMLSKDYDYPSPICEDCALKLDEFLLFRAKCLRSNEIYRFNRLHKQRFLFGSGRQNQPATADPKSPVDVEEGTKEQDTSAPAVEERCADDTEIVVRHTVPLATICEASGSSSSDSRTVIETEQRQAVEMLGTASSTEAHRLEDRIGMTDSKDHPATVAKDEPEDRLLGHGPPDTDGSNCSSRLSPAPVVLVIDETDTNTTSEEVDTIPLSETRALPTDDEPQNCLEGIRFPVETVEQLDRLERLVRTCDFARERYINLLRQLKTPHTSLTETYQQLFADRLLIHYNYDGISPKYNKRPLKTLTLFTDCMAAAWEDHMDIGKVKEAVIEAVRKSHNRYNQYNHRKRANYEWL